ncbi:MAG: recombinase family protein [Clostridia bacterium]|nr:recombinase family protein [Clostridia bacterium]
MAKIAIYARKSVFREDSISIESQIELCEYEARGEDYLVYKDNGYSGKNTDRPDFQRMISDIKAGVISKVIVYKLDRVSRSVLDFSELMDLFQKYKVDFVSATEHFDTSNPMGRAMLNICVVFAQLERETIQQRVIDAYASRSRKGFYMGGKIPYGYRKEPMTIDGVKTSMYVQEPNEADDIRLIYELYSIPSATLGDVLRTLKARGLNTNRRGKVWNTARLSEMMRNPIYTTNDISIYHFFKQQGSNLINPPEQFDGITSQYLFKGENTNRKTWDLSGQNIVIAPHRGFIPPDIWIACRKKLLANHQIKTCKAKNSFLSGKIKCGNCGYAIVVRFSQRSKGHVRYFIDTGWTQNHCCSHKLPTIHADDFEAMIVDKLKAKIDTLTIRAKAGAKDETQEQRKELEIKISKIESEIEALVNTMTKSEVDKVTIKYINSKIAELDEERTSVLNELDRLKTEQSQKNNTDYKVLRDVMSKWEKLSFDDKRSVVELLVRKILVYPDKVEIEWNI